jgi:hypothetical protein
VTLEMLGSSKEKKRLMCCSLVTLMNRSVESSKTWIIIRSGGHVRAHAAPMESLYTCKKMVYTSCSSSHVVNDQAHP